MSETSDGGAETHAVIDIGTNSIHLLIARLDHDGGFDVVRPGEGTGPVGLRGG